MSVAFRRESDEEHLEPKFELPIPPGPNLVTPRGLALIEGRVTELETLLADSLPEDERKAMLRDARYWRARQASAQLAPAPSGKTVAIGTRVTYQRDSQSRLEARTSAPPVPGDREAIRPRSSHGLFREQVDRSPPCSLPLEHPSISSRSQTRLR